MMDTLHVNADVISGMLSKYFKHMAFGGVLCSESWTYDSVVGSLIRIRITGPWTVAVLSPHSAKWTAFIWFSPSPVLKTYWMFLVYFTFGTVPSFRHHSGIKKVTFARGCKLRVLSLIVWNYFGNIHCGDIAFWDQIWNMGEIFVCNNLSFEF